MYCSECGAEIDDDSKFCSQCGKKIEQKEKLTINCPHCGKINNIKSVYCGYCGKFFEKVNKNNNLMTSNDDITDIMDYEKSLNIPKPQQIQYKEPSEYKAKCPKCGSTSLYVDKQGFGFGKAAAGVVLFGGVGVLAGGINANKTIVTCLNCKHKFKL